MDLYAVSQNPELITVTNIVTYCSNIGRLLHLQRADKNAKPGAPVGKFFFKKAAADRVRLGFHFKADVEKNDCLVFISFRCLSARCNWAKFFSEQTCDQSLTYLKRCKRWPFADSKLPTSN